MDLKISLWLNRKTEWNGYLSCPNGHCWAFSNVFDFSNLLEQVLTLGARGLCSEDSYSLAAGSGYAPESNRPAECSWQLCENVCPGHAASEPEAGMRIFVCDNGPEHGQRRRAEYYVLAFHQCWQS